MRGPTLFGLILLVLLPGCGGGGTPPSPPQPTWEEYRLIEAEAISAKESAATWKVGAWLLLVVGGVVGILIGTAAHRASGAGA